MSQENASWAALCGITDELWQKGNGGFGDRQEAFGAACRQRPDLAAQAIMPNGEYVIPRKGRAQRTPEASPLVKLAEKAAAEHARLKAPAAK